MKTSEFVARVRIAAPAAEVFAWHARPGAFERLTPPWEHVETVSRLGSIRDGDRTILRVKLGPFRRDWVAVHEGYQEGRQFSDQQVRGPFARWRHTHRVEPDGGAGSTLEDRIQYALPFGALGRALGGWFARRKLARLFEYRHETMAADLARHRAAGGRMYRIAVTGASGLVGSALVPFLTTGGHTVARMVRTWPPKDDGELFWDPWHAKIDAERLDGVDAVVHLAGESIAARWTPERKERIRASRVAGTRLIAETLARLARPPKVFISASAIGYYGPSENAVDERAPAGGDFLADVCKEWEAATAPAAERGIRVVNARIGVVLSPAGGALRSMLGPFRMGVGGRVGSGRQPMSWVALDDVVGAFHFALFNDALAGPINVVAPEPATNGELTSALGRALHRPTVMPLPAFAVKAIFGEMGRALLLEGARVLPRKLIDAGFEFRYPKLDGALQHLLGKG